MNDRKLDHLLDAWLDAGPTVAPNRLTEAARLEIRSTRQSAALPGWLRRFPSMNNTMRYGIAVAGLAVATLLSYSFLVGPNVGGPPDPVGTPLPAATPGALPTAASLQPGTYFIANPYVDADPVRSCERGCSDYGSIRFTLPDGWATADGLVFKNLGQANELAFSVWTPDQVYADPCHWQTSAVGPEGPLVPSANPYGIALQNQAGRGESTPIGVVFGGEQTANLASRIELSVPADLDITSCDRGEYRSWTEWDVPGSANSHHAAGQVDVVYLVDVDRRVLLIDASHMPGASQEELAELEAILASMVIHR